MFVSRNTALPGVGAIDVFASESHRGIGQPPFQDWQRVDEAASSPSRPVRERLEYNCVALAIRFESRTGRRPHEFRGNQNIASVIDHDNHRNSYYQW
jgi:hypothetical protein